MYVYYKIDIFFIDMIVFIVKIIVRVNSGSKEMYKEMYKDIFIVSRWFRICIIISFKG